MRSFYDLMGVPPTGFDPDKRFVTSPLFSPTIWGFWRLLYAIFGWANIIASWVYQGINDPQEIGQAFSYFTNLTWWGLTTYMTVMLIHTLVYAFTGRYYLQRWPKFLQVLQSLFYTTIVCYPPLVTIVYWGVLYRPPWFPHVFDAFSNVSRHGTNSLAALIEIFLAATNPPPLLQLVFLILILALYLGLAYVTYATEHFYVYNFLNPATGAGHVTAYVFGILAAIIVIFFIVWFLIWLRRKLTGTGKLSKRDVDVTGRNSRFNDVEMRAK